MNTQLRFVAGI